jgi:hypothetical protein
MQRKQENYIEDKVYLGTTDENGNFEVVLQTDYKMDKYDLFSEEGRLCKSCGEDITEALRPLTTSDKIFYPNGKYSINCPECKKCTYTLTVKDKEFTLSYKV